MIASSNTGAIKKRDISLENPENNSPPNVQPTNGVKSKSDTVSDVPWKKKSLCEVIKSKFFISVLVVCVVFVTLLCIGLVTTYEKDNDITLTVDAWNDKLSEEQLFWFNSGLDELKQAIRVGQNTKRAKNVILFVADGMGPTSVTAARIYKEKEEGHLIWERFPHMGLLKVRRAKTNNFIVINRRFFIAFINSQTYCADKQVPDSLCTATALFGGVKTNYETGGVDSSVKLADCTASLDPTNHVESILDWAQKARMGTGFVTTTRVMHATPSALYAHTPDRRWECDATMPATASACKDIARQLVETEPGNKINVIMGGGRQCLVTGVTGSDADPIDTWACSRKDGRNLIQDWERLRSQRKESYTVVGTTGELHRVSRKSEYVMGE